MTRSYSNLTNPAIHVLLDTLIDPNSTPEEYRESMQGIGMSLGNTLLAQIVNTQDGVCIASLAEDADILTKEVLFRLDSHLESISFTCFWNQYFLPFNYEDLEVAPIIKKYQEPSSRPIKYILFIKSIISKFCTIKTDLTDLLQEMNPEKIFIVAPVISPQTEQEFRSSFSEIYYKFQFLYFAKDDEFTVEGELEPGIGSNFYEYLGFSENTKNRHVPEIVKARRTRFVRA